MCCVAWLSMCLKNENDLGEGRLASPEPVLKISDLKNKKYILKT